MRSSCRHALHGLVVVLACVGLLAAPAPAAYANPPSGSGSVDQGSPSSDAPTDSGDQGANDDGTTGNRVQVPGTAQNPKCDPRSKGSLTFGGEPRSLAPSPLCQGFPFLPYTGECSRGLTYEDGVCKREGATYVWLDHLENCQVGFEVYTFYGTVKDPTQAVTRSRVEVPNWKCNGGQQSFRVCYPNAQDAQATTAAQARDRVARTHCVGKAQVANQESRATPWNERVMCPSTSKRGGEYAGCFPTQVRGMCTAASLAEGQTLAGYFDDPRFTEAVQRKVYRNYRKVIGPLSAAFPPEQAEAIARQFTFISPSVKGGISSPQDITAVGSTSPCSSIFQYAPVRLSTDKAPMPEGEKGAIGICVVGLSRAANSVQVPGSNQPATKAYDWLTNEDYSGSAARIWYQPQRVVLPASPTDQIGGASPSEDVQFVTLNGNRPDRDGVFAKYFAAVTDAWRNVPYADPSSKADVSQRPLGSIVFGDTGWPAESRFGVGSSAKTAFGMPDEALGLYPGGPEGTRAVQATLKRGLNCRMMKLDVVLEPAPPKLSCPAGGKPDGKGGCLPPRCEATGTCTDPCPDCLPDGPDPDPSPAPDPQGVHLRITLDQPKVFHVGGELSVQEVSVQRHQLMCSATRVCDQSTPPSRTSPPTSGLDPVLVGTPTIRLYVDSTSPKAFKECKGSRERSCSYLVKEEGSTTWQGIFFSPTNASQFMQPEAEVTTRYNVRAWRHRVEPGVSCSQEQQDNDGCVPVPPKDWWDPVVVGQEQTTQYSWVPKRPQWPVVGSTGS